MLLLLNCYFQREMQVLDFIAIFLLLTYLGTFGRKQMTASKRVLHILISVILPTSEIRLQIGPVCCGYLSSKVMFWGLGNSCVWKKAFFHLLTSCPQSSSAKTF